jgi:hypothetical protein
MPKYRHKPIIVDAIQWFKLGDHPAVIPMPEIFYNYQNQTFSKGYFADGHYPEFVSPGDWVITNSTSTFIMSDKKFKETYEEK